MSDIKLFRLTQGQATELAGDAADLEKPLQTLIENNLEPLLGIRFLASEYSIGKTRKMSPPARCWRVSAPSTTSNQSTNQNVVATKARKQSKEISC